MLCVMWDKEKIIVASKQLLQVDENVNPGKTTLEKQTIGFLAG